MENYPSLSEINQSISDLSPEGLADIRKYIEFIKFREEKKAPQKALGLALTVNETEASLEEKDNIIKLGGLLLNYNIDITEDDIQNVRTEMWSEFGKAKE